MMMVALFCLSSVAYDDCHIETAESYAVIEQKVDPKEDCWHSAVFLETNPTVERALSPGTYVRVRCQKSPEEMAYL